MDYKTTIERILAIEESMDVTAIQYKGLHIWPFVRMQLWQRLLHPNKYAPPAAIGLRRLAKKLSEGFFRPDFYAPYLEHAERHKKNLSELAAYGPTDVLLFSRETEHNQQFGGRWYNHHLDSLVDLIKTRHTFLKLELITDRTEKTLPRFEYTHFFDSLDYLRCDAQRSVIAAFQEAPRILAIENGKQLTSLLAGTRFDLALTEEYLMIESERMLHYIRYFRELLTVVSPKVVFLANYHDTIGMALTTACKAMDIKVVDVQTGRRSQYHGMYSHWLHLPEEGYEMLPTHFWCWGKSSAAFIRDSRAHDEVQPEVIIGGHPWLAKWLDADPTGFPVDSAGQKFIERINAYQKVILVTLQQEHREIPDELLEAIQKAPADWFWLIRLHPRQKEKAALLSDTLYDLHIDHADVEQATNLPLFYLLKHSHRHVTQRSSVAVEALRFKVPTVITHAAGKALYQKHINEGFFIYADHAEEIINALYQPTAGVIEDPPYIETNRMYALTALHELMADEQQIAESQVAAEVEELVA